MSVRANFRPGFRICFRCWVRNGFRYRFRHCSGFGANFSSRHPGWEGRRPHHRRTPRPARWRAIKPYAHPAQMYQTAFGATIAPAAHEEFMPGQPRDAERHLPAPWTLCSVNGGADRFFHFHAELVPDLGGLAINLNPCSRALQILGGILSRTSL